MKKALTIGIVLSCVAAGGAHAETGLTGFAPRLSYVSPDGLDGAIGVGILVDWGEFSPGFGFETSVDYWSSSTEADGPGMDVGDFVIGGRVRYAFSTMGSGLTPYVAGGLAWHFFSMDRDADYLEGPYASLEEDSETHMNIDLAGGLKIPSSESLEFIVEAGLRPADRWDQFVISGAVNIKMGQ